MSKYLKIGICLSFTLLMFTLQFVNAAVRDVEIHLFWTLKDQLIPEKLLINGEEQGKLVLKSYDQVVVYLKIEFNYDNTDPYKYEEFEVLTNAKYPDKERFDTLLSILKSKPTGTQAVNDTIVKVIDDDLPPGGILQIEIYRKDAQGKPVKPQYRTYDIEYKNEEWIGSLGSFINVIGWKDKLEIIKSQSGDRILQYGIDGTNILDGPVTLVSYNVGGDFYLSAGTTVEFNSFIGGVSLLVGRFVLITLGGVFRMVDEISENSGYIEDGVISKEVLITDIETDQVFKIGLVFGLSIKL